MPAKQNTHRRNVVTIKTGLLRPKRGPEVRVDDTPVLIGRAAACGLVINDPQASAVHCEVAATEDGVHVRDRGSTNGTFVGGLRIRDAWLSEPCSLRVGATTIAFEPTGREPLALPAAGSFGELIGTTQTMRRVIGILGELAATDLSFLITGETGTGKDLAARAVHAASARANGPFIVLDCGSIPPSLAESALFGHERGAFTDARERTDGAFHQAHRGTLFLDEIGELPLDVQAKLLRALAERQVKRIGGRDYDSVDARIVAATHRDLGRRVNEGLFREDLFFRFATLQVKMPPLRERREDVPLIARAVCERISKGDRAADVVEMLEHELRDRAWSGNVRELVNVVEAAALLPPGAEALAIALGSDGRQDDASPSGPFAEAKLEAFKQFERGYFTKLFEQCEGNVSKMGRESGLGRDKVRLHLKNCGLRES